MQVIRGTVDYAVAHASHTAPSGTSHFDIAAKAIGFAVLFDGLDGRVARMTGTTSDFGRELDSLADVNHVRNRACAVGLGVGLSSDREWHVKSRSRLPRSDEPVRSQVSCS